MKIEKHWYKELIDDLKGIITEGVFTSRDVLIETYHEVGEKIRTTSNKENMEITELVNKCAVDMEVSDRKLWYAVKFFDKYPDRSLVPGGKNQSWNKIKTLYLTEGKEKGICEHNWETFKICSKCKEKQYGL